MNALRPLLALGAGLLLSTPAFAQNAPPRPTVIESDGRGEMVSTDKETTITFRDNVRVTGTGMKLTCEFLQVVVVRSGDPAAALGNIEKFRSMLATGNVRIIQSDREAACGRAEVLPKEDKIVLSDLPVIVFHAEGARQAGKKITMYRGQRRVEVEEPVTTLPAIKDLGFDQEPKPSAPPAEEPEKP